MLDGMEGRAALVIEPVHHIGPELAGIRDPFDRVLGWAGVLLLLALFLPLEREGTGAVWYWHLIANGDALVPLFAQIGAGILLVALSRVKRPRLDKAIAALLTLAAGTLALLFDGHATADLLVLLPRPFASRGLLFAISTASAAACVAWRSGPFAEHRPRLFAVVLALLSTAFALPLIGSTLVTSLMPAGIAAYALQASWQQKKQEPAAIGWIIAIPAGVIVTVGFKGALAYGNPVLMLLGLRGAALFLAFTLIASFSIASMLAQLFDRLGTEAPRPTMLLRDELLFRVLDDAIRTGMPRFRRHLLRYRGTVGRLVRRRFQALLEDAREEFPPPRSREELLLRMRRQLIDDRDPIAPKRPRASRLIHFLARGRNLELSTVAIALLAVAAAGLLHLMTLPRRAEWPLRAEEPWMVELYARRLPNIGIASGNGSYPGRDRRLRRTIAEAAALARSEPDLEDAIRALTPTLLDLPEKSRALARAVDRINEAARESGVPFYLDVDLVSSRRGRGFVQYVYVKSYRIERVRHATQGFGEYTALWLRRADRTNLLDARLGWTKKNEHHGMIVLDVVRDYWKSDVAPALAGIEESRVQRIYGRYRERIAEEIAHSAAALSESDPSEWRVLLESRLDCFLEARPECGALEALVDTLVIEVLARKVETHELQHVIDGSALVHPEPLRLLMRTYSEDAITFAAAELSAYLAEVARSGQPRIALVHFLALAMVQPHSPEGFAGRVALDHLLRDGEESIDLFDLPPEELAERARIAHESLFGSRLLPLTRTDA